MSVMFTIRSIRCLFLMFCLLLMVEVVLQLKFVAVASLHFYRNSYSVLSHNRLFVQQKPSWTLLGTNTVPILDVTNRSGNEWTTSVSHVFTNKRDHTSDQNMNTTVPTHSPPVKKLFSKVTMVTLQRNGSTVKGTLQRGGATTMTTKHKTSKQTIPLQKTSTINRKVTFKGQLNKTQSRFSPNTDIYSITQRVTSKQSNDTRFNSSYTTNVTKVAIKDSKDVKIKSVRPEYDDSYIALQIKEQSFIRHLPRFKVDFRVSFEINKPEAMLYGKLRNTIGFLTIGLVSVQREGISYVEKTIKSLIRETSNEEKNVTTVVVLLSDYNHDVIIKRARKLYTLYRQHINSGFIRIIHPDHGFYPNFSNVEQTFNDSMRRIEWRSKQNIDYSYLFLYVRDISKYFLHIEDDVIAMPKFVGSVKRFIDVYSSNPWFTIDFSSMGFIGKLMRSVDLKGLAEYFLYFFDIQPCDLLFAYYMTIKGQPKRIRHYPSLFQHLGVISSLPGKKQYIVDKRISGHTDFMLRRKRHHLLNPSANIYTTMKSSVRADNQPEFVYDRDDIPFVVDLINKDDNITIVFQHPQNITRLYVGTGYLFRGRLLRGRVYASIKRDCSWVFLGNLTDGTFDSSLKNHTTVIPNNCSCLSVVANEPQIYVLFVEISVFTKENVGIIP